MADQPPSQAYIVLTAGEWPLQIFASSSHLTNVLKDNKKRAFLCDITVVQEVELVKPEPYLRAKGDEAGD